MIGHTFNEGELSAVTLNTSILVPEPGTVYSETPLNRNADRDCA